MTDLDARARWAGLGTVVVAAVSAVAMLESTTLNAWTGGGAEPASPAST
jgi:hypothetical protein